VPEGRVLWPHGYEKQQAERRVPDSLPALSVVWQLREVGRDRK